MTNRQVKQNRFCRLFSMLLGIPGKSYDIMKTGIIYVFIPKLSTPLIQDIVRYVALLLYHVLD